MPSFIYVLSSILLFIFEFDTDIIQRTEFLKIIQTRLRKEDEKLGLGTDDVLHSLLRKLSRVLALDFSFGTSKSVDVSYWLSVGELTLAFKLLDVKAFVWEKWPTSYMLPNRLSPAEYR